jgi:predicted TIM-barrel fold metal-dependent hydrolase
LFTGLGLGDNRLRLVDAHTHTSGSDRDAPPDEALAFMDTCGMERAFLFAPLLNPSGLQISETHLDAVRTNNEYIAHYCAADPERLYAFCVLNPNPGIAGGDLHTAVRLMIDEARRCYHELGLRGVKMVPDGWNCEQAEVRPLLEEIAALGMYAVFHAGIFMDERSSSFCRPTLYEGAHRVPGFHGHLAHLGWPWEDELIAMLLMEGEHRANSDAADPWQLKTDFAFGAPPDWRVSTLTKAMNLLAHDQFIYGSDMWWPLTPEQYYEQYLLPHLAAFELAASLARNWPASGTAERSAVRDAVFSDNVLTHWDKATRGVAQAPRRAASAPQTADTRHA